MAQHGPDFEKLENKFPPAPGLITSSVGTENITWGRQPRPCTGTGTSKNQPDLQFALTHFLHFALTHFNLHTLRRNRLLKNQRLPCDSGLACFALNVRQRTREHEYNCKEDAPWNK
jgi:hypothetical protein